MCNQHDHLIQKFHDDIVTCCLKSSACIPESGNKNGRKKKRIPGWNENIKPYKCKALFWHSIWKDNGRPETGLIVDIRRKTRRDYHNALRSHAKSDDINRMTNMATKCLSDDRRDFWSEVKKMLGNTKSLPQIVDDAHGTMAITEVFKSKYDTLYNSVPYDKLKMETFQNHVDTLIGSNSGEQCNYCTSHSICADDVNTGICSLKHNKTDGNKGLTSGHLKNGTHTLNVYLALLLNAMVIHSYVPDDMRISTLIPIPKCKRQSSNVSNNYRAIALSSILGKLVDVILISRYRTFFKTNDSQFGFKKDHSTSQCIFVANEILQYYMNNGSTVYAVMLDASKAFDRIEYVKLFTLLLERKLCPVIIRLLLAMYTQQGIRVKWGDNMSDFSTVSNGIKQGGILSPLLFTVYIDTLFTKLRESRNGCYIGNVFCGALGYADDVMILSPTVASANHALKICSSYAKEFEVVFNPAKSKVIVCGKTTVKNPEIYLDQTKIEVISSDKYLGYVIGSDSMRQNVDICVSEFYYRVNMMKSIFKYVPIRIKYMLFKTYCMPLYGSQLWDYSSKHVLRYYTSWRKAIRNLFDLPYATHCELLHNIFNDTRINMQLYSRFRKFIKKLTTTNNALTKLCLRLAMNGSGSNTGNSITHLTYVLGVPRDVIPDLTNEAFRLVDSSDTHVANASVIMELMQIKCNEMALSGISNSIPKEEVTALLNAVCVD